MFLHYADLGVGQLVTVASTTVYYHRYVFKGSGIRFEAQTERDLQHF